MLNCKKNEIQLVELVTNRPQKSGLINRVAVGKMFFEEEND